MDSKIPNQIKVIKNLSSLLKFCCELDDDKTLGILSTITALPDIKDKLENYKISPNFNFKLLKKLQAAKQLFNYLKLSKKNEKQKKWYNEILKVVPQLADLQNETHTAFDYYKNTISSYLNNFSINQK